MRSALIFVAALVAGCNGGTYVVVSVDSVSPLQGSAFDVTLANAGQTAHVHVTRDGGFAIPPPVSFALQLDGSRHGDASIALALVDGSGAVVGQASGDVTIVSGGTARVTLTVGGVAGGGDLATGDDLGGADLATADMTMPPADMTMPPADMTTFVHNDPTNSSFWTPFDVAGSVSSTYAGFSGGTFDGRYVYFFPHYNGGFDGIVVRHDTQALFTDVSSWTSFNVATKNGNAIGFSGGTFDGRYVYVSGTSPNASTGFLAQYDTTLSFTDGNSWTVFDTSTVNAKSVGFVGAVFDGRYVYFVPHDPANPEVTAYDTTLPFGSAGSWTPFDPTTINGGATGFFGAQFDGRYVYFIPSAGTPSSIATRYDTHGSFTDAGSWLTFDTTGVNAASKNFNGGAFDGRFVYYLSTELTRYDTTLPFNDAGSWKALDTTTVSASINGINVAAFDGDHFLFFFSGNGILARYDATTAFSASGSWVTFNLTTLNANAKGWSTAVFDGRFIYLEQYSPGNNGGFSERFDAKTPPFLPPLYHGGSFF